MAITPTPNMSLPVPVVGVESGPDYAVDINNCMLTIDSHSHVSGSGVPVTPLGLNISSDLTFLGNNALALRTTTFSAQASPLTTSDVRALYAVGTDLYFNNGNGVAVQLTIGPSIAGTPGSITNLVAPASASYLSGPGTFQFQSATNTPAGMDVAAITIRPQSLSSNGLTIQPPPAIAADYTITMPSLPAATAIVTMDVSGNQVASTGGYLALSPTGSVTMFASNSIPSGWLVCQGQNLSTTTYAGLFAVIGYTFGGAGAVFNVPYMVDRVPVGAGGTLGSLGAGGGALTHTLTGSEMPTHAHTIVDVSHNHGSFAGNYITDGSSAGVYVVGGDGAFAGNTANSFTGITGTDNAGGGGGHNNVQPYVALNFIIKT